MIVYIMLNDVQIRIDEAESQLMKERLKFVTIERSAM